MGRVSELARLYRTIVLDLPGYYRSDYMDTTDVYLHKKAVEYIIGLLEQLHIDPAYIMGLSSGRLITLYIATMKPWLAKKIIIISGQVYYSETTRKFITSMGLMVDNPEDLSLKIKLHGKQKGTPDFKSILEFTSFQQTALVSNNLNLRIF